MNTPSHPQAPQAGNLQTPPSDEFTIRDLIKEYRVWKGLIRRNWMKLILAGAIGGALGYFYAARDIPMYVANTRFMLKNEGVGSLFGGQMTGLTSLLGGGQMGTPLERTAEVIASDRIVGRTLLREMTIGDSTDLVINHFIRLTNVRKAWAKDTLLRDVRFELGKKDIEQLSIAQRKAYKSVKSMLIPDKGVGVVRKTFDKKSGVLTLSCVHRHEAFAIALSKIIYDELNLFFVEQMTFTSTNNADVMKKKLDSIQGQLNSVRRSYARQTDQSLGLLLQQDKVDLKGLAVREQMLTVMYAEALKNYESFQFVNQAAIPSLTLIDAPYSPLPPSQKSKKTYVVALSGILTFFSFAFLRLNKYFKSIIV